MKAVTTVEMSKWEEIPLGKLVSFEKGRVVTTQGYETAGALPYIGAENFSGALTLYTTDPTAVLCEPTDVIMLWDGERSGLCSKGLKGAIGSTVVRLRPRNTIDVGYLYHQLARFFPWIQARRTGTGVPHVPKDLSSILWLPVPNDAKEQCRIAKALDTVDEAIANTEAVLAKLRQVRAGLLHNLLTRGLDEKGELRDLIRHPEQFKDTEIGRIPLEWHLKKIDEIKANSPHSLAMGPFGSNIAVNNFVHEGIPVIRGVNLNGPIIDFSEVVFVSEGKANELISSNIVWNDIVFTHRGTVGQVSLFKENSEYDRAVVSQSQLKITCDRKVVSPPFFSLYFNSAFGQKLINLAKAHTGVQAIGQPLSSIRGMKIPLPRLDEQHRIEAVLTDIDGRITMEEAYRKKLLQIKAGLRSDLLTARVRVPEDLELPK